MIGPDPLVGFIFLIFIAAIAAYVGWTVGNDRGGRR